MQVGDTITTSTGRSGSTRQHMICAGPFICAAADLVYAIVLRWNEAGLVNPHVGRWPTGRRRRGMVQLVDL